MQEKKYNMTKKIFNKSVWIAITCLVLFILVGLIIDYKIDSKKTGVVEVIDSIPVDSFMYVTLTDSAVLLHLDIQYRKEGQKPRFWNREIYYSDMDSITVVRWDSLSSKERVEAIRKSFLFDSDVDWDSYTYEEQEEMLLGNTFIEWN